MADVSEDEADGAAERCLDPAPHSASIPPFARCGRPETRYRMELGNQLCGLISDVGIRSTSRNSDASRDRSPRGVPDDQHEAPLEASDTTNHGDEVGPSTSPINSLQHPS